MYGTNGRCGWHDQPLSQGPGIILGRKGQGHLGVVWCEVPFWVIDTAYYVELDEREADLRWFYFLTQYVGLDHLKTGEKPGLQREVFQAQVVPFPPKPVQERIRDLLGALDDKIALNRRMNRTLEVTAAALFKKWCDDNEASTSSIPTAQLIARGVLLINDGYRAKNAELAETGLPFARAGNLQSHFDFVGADLLGEAGVRAAREKVSQPFDCVFTSKGTVGRIAQVLPSTPAFVYSPQLCFWRSRRPEVLNPFVLNQWMNGDEFREQVDGVKGQTDMADYVSLRDQRRMLVTLPFVADQKAIGSRLESLAMLQDANMAESRTLTALRDTLLPQLLSGAIRLRQAEKLVELAV